MGRAKHNDKQGGSSVKTPIVPKNLSKAARAVLAKIPTTSGVEIQHKIKKVEDPAKWRRKIFPEVLCINLRTGNMDVSAEFFWKVWDEHKTDTTWKAWVCTVGTVVTGVLVTQVFVHDSVYFRWGPPLSKMAESPDPLSGEVKNVVEIGILCAKKCGTKLLEEVMRQLAEHTDYDYVVLNSTPAAVDWYAARGFKRIQAYRLPTSKPGSDEHLYRHRIGDGVFNPQQDLPSIMMYRPIIRTDAQAAAVRTKRCRVSPKKPV